MLWQQCLNKLESELTDQEINTWLRTLHGTEHDGVLVLLAPNTFVYQHVKDQHLDLIKDKVKQISNGSNIQVILQIGAGESVPFQQENSIQTNDDPAKKAPIHASQHYQSPKPLVTEKSFTNNLNTTMTFDNFVEGKSNHAHPPQKLHTERNSLHCSKRNLGS